MAAHAAEFFIAGFVFWLLGFLVTHLMITSERKMMEFEDEEYEQWKREATTPPTIMP